jgi:hypothetical protein
MTMADSDEPHFRYERIVETSKRLVVILRSLDHYEREAALALTEGQFKYEQLIQSQAETRAHLVRIESLRAQSEPVAPQ